MFEESIRLFIDMLIVSGGIGGLMEVIKRVTGLHKSNQIFKRLQAVLSLALGLCIYYFFMPVDPLGVRLTTGVIAGATASGGYSAVTGIKGAIEDAFKREVDEEGQDG